jgi:hypothetical protein
MGGRQPRYLVAEIFDGRGAAAMDGRGDLRLVGDLRGW